MPALNFKKVFANDVESGQKRQTIRKFRKDGRDPRSGQTLYLYTGMRTKSCRKLSEDECVEALPIWIDQHENGIAIIILDGDQLDSVGIAKIAKADGFKNTGEFLTFFGTRFEPFYGLLIRW